MVKAGVLGLREAVRLAYSGAAETPRGDHPFPLGRAFAESLGYPPDLLRDSPSVSVDVFAGVSDVSVFADLPSGATVLDLGCGGGLDSLIAARRVGPMGRVLGVDFSHVMLARARDAAREAGVSNLELYLADAEELPVEDHSVDVALVNGIFNLNPARATIFRELARVVKTGGSVYAAELILRGPLPPEIQASESSWFA
jgi:arsenite methyltransferase